MGLMEAGREILRPRSCLLLGSLPTGLFAFCSSWFLSHFPGGGTSGPIRVAAEQGMADMRVLREEGFFLFVLVIYPFTSPGSWRVLSQPAPA